MAAFRGVAEGPAANCEGVKDRRGDELNGRVEVNALGGGDGGRVGVKVLVLASTSGACERSGERNGAVSFLCCFR
jgi:hypothetical protein